MRAVFKRELRSLLLSVRGIVFLGVYLFFAGVFTALYHFRQGYAGFEISLSYLVPVLVMIVPLLSANAFASDRVQGEDRILRMLPLRTRDIVFGKYLARLAVMGIPTAFLMLYPLILDLYGTVSYAVAYISLLALFLIGAILLALGMLISHRAASLRYATAWSYIGFATWYAIGILVSLIPGNALASLIACLSLGVLLGGVLAFATKRWWLAGGISLAVAGIPAILYFVARSVMEGAFASVVTFLSPFRAFDRFVFGVLDLGILLTYLIWIGLFLLLTAVVYQKKHGVNRSGGSKNKFIVRASALVLSLCIVGGALVAFLSVWALPSRVGRLDATLEKSYTVSKENRSFLSTLADDVTIYVIDSDRSDIRFEMFLDTLSVYSKHLHVRYVDSATDSSFLSERGLSSKAGSPYGLWIEGRGRGQYVGYDNLFSFYNKNFGQMSLSSYQTYLYMFQSNSQYADYLSSLLYETEQYFDGETVIMAVIEYVSAPQIPTVYLLEGYGTRVSESMIAYMMAYYGVEYKTLDFSSNLTIPSDASSLVLAKPQRDISTDAANAIRAFLKNGGQLTVLTDQSNLSMPNLCALLAEYEMTPVRGVLTESVKSEDSDEVTESTMLALTPNFQHDMLAPYEEESGFSVSVTDSHAIAYSANPSGSLIITPLLSTSDQAYLAGEAENKKTYAVAVAAETAEGARVVWFAGADSYLGTSSDSPSKSMNNALCVLLATNWTTKSYQSVLTSATSKPYTVTALNIGQGAATAWGIIFIVLIPAVAVSIPAVRRYGRKKVK